MIFQTSEIKKDNDPKMFRKRKVNPDGRLFQERWEGEYMFVLQREKPVCLLCYEAVVKEYNQCQHFYTKHGTNYAKVSLEKKHSIVQELKGKLRLQQDMFKKASAKNDAAVKDSFIMAEEIAHKSFSEGEFLKEHILKGL